LMWNSPDAVREILNTRLNAASRAQLAARRSTAQEQGN